MTKKRLLGISFILCLLFGIVFMGYSFYTQHICSLWDIENHQCYECNYSRPVFVGIDATNRCSERKFVGNCCYNGYYSVPNNYIDSEKHFECNPNVLDCGMAIYHLRETAIKTGCISAFAFVALIFIIKFVFKKLQKKSLLNRIVKIFLILLMVLTGFFAATTPVVIYVTRSEKPLELNAIVDTSERAE